MKKNVANVKGRITLNVYYSVEDVPDRRRYESTYRPDTVHVELATGISWPAVHMSRELGTQKLLSEAHPVVGIDLMGKRLKKDGTPGTLDVTEHLYGFSLGNGPDWVQQIVEEILLNLT